MTEEGKKSKGQRFWPAGRYTDEELASMSVKELRENLKSAKSARSNLIIILVAFCIFLPLLSEVGTLYSRPAQLPLIFWIEVTVQSLIILLYVWLIVRRVSPQIKKLSSRLARESAQST